MGTEGTIEITVGTGEQPALGLWFYEPNAVKVTTADAAKEIARAAGATVAKTPGGGFRGMPILLDRDQITGEESFIQRELKYARRWLYAKGLMVPEEDRDPVTAELEAFFECCRAGRRPKADLEAGLRRFHRRDPGQPRHGRRPPRPIRAPGFVKGVPYFWLMRNHPSCCTRMRHLYYWALISSRAATILWGRPSACGGLSGRPARRRAESPPQLKELPHFGLLVS